MNKKENLKTVEANPVNSDVTEKKMNIYEKLQKIKLELLKSNLKKSGENKFAGFKYYELGDFLPKIIELCDKYKVCTIMYFRESQAILTAVNCEDSDEFADVGSPLEKMEIKGANAIQSLGGAQTYMRRYLYMAMFDICENDVFDSLLHGKEKTESYKEKFTPKKEYLCSDCGKKFQACKIKDKWVGSDKVYEIAGGLSSDKKARCKECRQKFAEEEKKAQSVEPPAPSQTNALSKQELEAEQKIWDKCNEEDKRLVSSDEFQK